MASSSLPTTDPILIKRRRLSRWVGRAITVGYVAFGLALVLFFFGELTGIRGVTTPIVTSCMVVGCVVMAPAMVTKYAIKAADRADREGSW